MEPNYNAVTCQCPKDPATSRTLQASQTQLSVVSSNRSLDLDLVTEEGDKVTLSVDTQSSAIYAAYGEMGMADDSIRGQWGEFSGSAFEREISWSVEGDLNHQERREIRKVIKTLHRMMNDFVHGRLNPMAAKAQRLLGLETIESLEVDMSYERQVLIAQQTEAAVAYDRTGGMLPRRGNSGIAGQLPIQKEAEVVQKEAEVVATEMAAEVVSAPAPLDPLKELADRLLQAYRDQAAEMNAFATRMVDHIRDIFEAAIGEDGRTALRGEDESTMDSESD